MSGGTFLPNICQKYQLKEPGRDIGIVGQLCSFFIPFMCSEILDTRLTLMARHVNRENDFKMHFLFAQIKTKLSQYWYKFLFQTSIFNSNQYDCVAGERKSVR